MNDDPRGGFSMTPRSRYDRPKPWATDPTDPGQRGDGGTSQVLPAIDSAGEGRP